MTVAAKDHLGGGGGDGGLRRRGGGGAHSWRRLWQIPLLLAGLALFGVGVRAVVRAVKPVPFERQSDALRILIALEEKAPDEPSTARQAKVIIEKINVLADFYRDRAAQAELHLLAGDVHYLAQQKEPALVRANYQRVLDHYGRAVELGLAPTVEMNERWGVAAFALGDGPLAIDKFEAALKVNPTLVRVHGRDLVSAYTARGQLAEAQQMLGRLLAARGAGGEDHDNIDEQAWAWCKQIEIALLVRQAGQKAQEQGTVGERPIPAATGPDSLDAVVERARAAVQKMPERDPSGLILTWIGRAELELGAVEAARRDLAEARTHFIARHMDDGRAALLLGKIAEAKADLDAAGDLYQDVVRAHAGTALWPAARMGRAEIAVRKEKAISPQSFEDYHFAIQAVMAKENTPELVSRASVRSALVADFERASEGGRLEEALGYLALVQELKEPENAALAFRLAETMERRGDELLAQAATGDEQAHDEKAAAGRVMYAESAEAYLRHAKLTTMDDLVSSNSLWKAAQLFDRAGKPLRSIAVYDRFTIERPRDPRVPEGLFSIGRLYQSGGMFEKAIEAYERTIHEHPKTQASYTAAVGLARCHMALQDAAGGKNPELAAAEFDKAEAALLSLVQNNEDVTPAANQYRTSLFTLGDLYYRNGRWADAILRLEEAVKRYPADPGIPRALFMLAECYRKSARDIAEAIRKDPAIAGRNALESARAERLTLAAELFTRVIAILDAHWVQGDAMGEAAPQPKLTALEVEYVHTSYLDRAECYFDRGDFAAAIKLYDETATRFSEEPAAVRAYVQIVNAYLAMREPTQASAAAERGRWILKRIPDEAFAVGPVAVGRDYYEKLLALGRN